MSRWMCNMSALVRTSSAAVLIEVYVPMIVNNCDLSNELTWAFRQWC